MLTAAIALHVTVCIALVVVVLLQRGKGAEVGAVFGGSSQTVFGASGAGGALFRLTWTLAAIFFATSLYLAYSSTRRVTGSIFQDRSVTTHMAPSGAKSGAPAVPSGAPAKPASGASAPASNPAPPAK